MPPKCGIFTLFIFLLITTTIYFYFPKFSVQKISKTAVEVNFIQNYINLKNGTSFENSLRKSYKNKKVKHHVPKYMLDLYDELRSIQKSGVTMKNRPDVVKSVIPKQANSLTGIHAELEKGHLLIFDVPFSNGGEILSSAELRVLTLVKLEPHSNENGAERIFRISFYDEVMQQAIQLEKKYIYHTNNTWISFNMTAAVRHVLSRKSSVLKVIVTVHAIRTQTYNNAMDILVQSNSENTQLERNYPLLVLSYSTPKTNNVHSNQQQDTNSSNRRMGRYKRNTELIEDYEEESNHVWSDDSGAFPQASKRKRRLRNTCRKKSLYVDFADINYDSWIVQPTGYEAYQCLGKCFYPVADHLSPTKHAVIQALMHNIAPQSTPRSCCVPTRLGPISILYIDANGILTYRYGYQDMVVLECGCR